MSLGNSVIIDLFCCNINDIKQICDLLNYNVI